MGNAALGRKQRISNEAWIETIKNIENIIPKSDIDKKVGQTVKAIKKITKGKKVAFAWSGGKDSLVLEQLCYKAGISECVLVICNMEYKGFLQWVTDHMPENLEVIDTKQDLKWLDAHPHMLFPQNSNIAAQWFHIVQHRGQAIYYKEHQLDMIMLGRRKADGNYVGKGSNIYTDSKGVTRYSPLSDWTHEEILAFIHYYKIPLPPFYEWSNGYYCGTHPWPARQWTGSIANGWKEVYTIDKTIVINAADYITSAREFLESEVI